MLFIGIGLVLLLVAAVGAWLFLRRQQPEDSAPTPDRSKLQAIKERIKKNRKDRSDSPDDSKAVRLRAPDPTKTTKQRFGKKPDKNQDSSYMNNGEPEVKKPKWYHWSMLGSKRAKAAKQARKEAKAEEAAKAAEAAGKGDAPEPKKKKGWFSMFKRKNKDKTQDAEAEQPTEPKKKKGWFSWLGRKKKAKQDPERRRLFERIQFEPRHGDSPVMLQLLEDILRSHEEEL